MELSGLPVNCECGAAFTIDHVLSCKKGGFISLLHNEVRNLTANLLNEVCKDVSVEPMLLPLTGEVIAGSISTDNAQSDVHVMCTWILYVWTNGILRNKGFQPTR